MLELKNVCSGYGKKQVLDDASVSFEKGKITSIIGSNGCGKSTLLKTAVGIIKPWSGCITADNEDVCKMTPKSVAQKIAYLAQGRSVPDMTVGQMVLHGRFAYLDYPRRYRQIDIEKATSAMKKMHVEDLAGCHMATLSGGMRQNVYIAMALAQDTDFILMDEPTTYLDIANRIGLMEILKALATEGKGIVTVLHDITLAMEYSDLITVMENGKVLVTDTPENIYNSKIINRVFGVEIGRAETETGFAYYCIHGEVHE